MSLLDKINERQEENAKGGGSQGKILYNFEKNKTLRLRFMNEWDELMPVVFYKPKYGEGKLPFPVPAYLDKLSKALKKKGVDPKELFVEILDSQDSINEYCEGDKYENESGWKKEIRYFNWVYDYEDGTIKAIGLTATPQYSPLPAVLAHANDPDYETITGMDFKITQKGDGLGKSFNVVCGKEKPLEKKILDEAKKNCTFQNLVDLVTSGYRVPEETKSALEEAADDEKLAPEDDYE